MRALRFGDGFELDPNAFELRQAGSPVRLERIPMEILLLLIERRPALVTREEIAEKVWGKGVFLDIDNSINGAIRKIRQALKDDSEEPRCVRTITGKGYRFIAPLEDEPSPEAAVGSPPPASASLPASASPPALASTPAPQSAAPPAPAAAAPPAATLSRRRAPVRPWALLAIAIALVGLIGVYRPWSRNAPAPNIPAGRSMLAVMPFDNLTGDPAQDYFSDGFTEEMISRLGNLDASRLGVIARTSVMHYKQARTPLDRLGRELGVEYVLEGSIRRDETRVRVTAQLIQTRDQTHLWSRQYDRAVADVLRVQSEIALAIADQIEITLAGPDEGFAHPAALSPRAYEAYDHYLQGLYQWNRRTADGFQQAIEAFQQAIALNPRDARAHSGLANAHVLTGTYIYVPQAEAFARAREAALAAIDLDPRLAAAHVSLALINEFGDFDWQTAGERFRRAIALDPNYPTAHHWYAEYLAHLGRFDEARAEIDLALRLDPHSLIIAADRGVHLYFARRFEAAGEQLEAVLARAPGFGRAHMIIYADALQGQPERALARVEEWQTIQDGPWLGAEAAYLYGRMGRMAEARRALEAMEEVNRKWKQDTLFMQAQAYVGMGLNHEALDCLEQLCRKRSGLLVSLKVDPIFDPLRADPRFTEVLRCANLDP